MTPLNTNEQIILAGIVSAFVIGAGVLAWQDKTLDAQLAGFESKAYAVAPIAKKPTPRGVRQADALSLNKATPEELETLPGVGPKLAQEIIAYRNVHPFRSVNDLDKVPGIGPKKFEKLKERVRVE